MTSDLRQSERGAPAPIWLLAFAMLALLAGMWAGLLRMGWAWPVLSPTLPMMHGPLMVGGFLGTVIGLERAVGTGKRWTYAGPILTGAGTIALLVAADSLTGPLLITAGSSVLVGAMWTVYRLQPALFSATLVMGGASWLAGNFLWLYGLLLYQVVLWWAGFLILTIAGERLELSRLLSLSRFARRSFALLSLLLLTGMAGSVVDLALGTRLAGLAMLGLALWLFKYDIAGRIRAGGQARFIAVCLLTGYVWLGFGGLLGMRFAGLMVGPQYDAYLHAIFLGFVFSMIVGHALIIFPALLQVKMVYGPWLYSHLILLHVTLVLRVAGDGSITAVVMDVSLADTRVDGERVDGVELTRRLRALPGCRHLPVVLLTAHAMRGDREQLLFSSGANDYVAKPITDQQGFVSLLRRHIDSSGSSS